MRMNDATYTDLVNLRDRLDGEQAKLHKQLEDVRHKLDSVSMTLSLLDDGPNPTREHAEDLSPSPNSSIDVVSLRGMTQLGALKKIAEHAGGKLHTSHAKRIMIQAGRIKNPKNANNIIFSVIHRSGEFERVEPGVYRVIQKPVRPGKPETAKIDW